MGKGAGSDGKPATSRRYSDEFKADAVALFRSSGRSIAQVAGELGISDSSLGSWVRAAGGDPPPATPDEAKQEAALRRRVRELEEEIEILKRFTRYWVKDEGNRR
jgi:transposase